MNNSESIVVGMSGGVDSSVAAWRLLQQGCKPIGLFMQNWAEDTSKNCRVEEDRKDAVTVCGQLGIPFHFRRFVTEYRQEVFAHFLNAYARGRTPNPDVLCNKEIKFKHFLTAAQELGAESIATGHYARIDRQGKQLRLLRGADPSKDQSYFLHQLQQSQLSFIRFPIGDLEKSTLRKIATEARLVTSAKKDSVGICFIGKRDFRSFLARYLPQKPGNICDPTGTVIAVHQGVFYFTLGQREGLQIGGVSKRAQAPWYVVGKNVPSNILYVDQNHNSPYLLSTTLQTEQAHWISGSPPSETFECYAQTRYRQNPDHCKVSVQNDGTLQVAFSREQRAVTPGQSLVLYDGPVCLGGATITATNAPLELSGKTVFL